MEPEQIIHQLFNDKRISINDKSVYFKNGKLEIQQIGQEHLVYGQYSIIVKDNKICLKTVPAILSDSNIIVVDIVLGGQVVLDF